MKFSANQAAKEAGVAKATLLDALKTGRMSADKTDKGHWQIDAAELFRVFPKPVATDQTEPSPTPQENWPTSQLQAELEALRQQIETTGMEREREREQLTDQIADLRSRLDRESEERRALTAMITDQRPKPRRGLFGWIGGRG